MIRDHPCILTIKGGTKPPAEELQRGNFRKTTHDVYKDIMAKRNAKRGNGTNPINYLIYYSSLEETREWSTQKKFSVEKC